MCGWRQNLQDLTPATLSSLGRMDDWITFPVTKKVGGSITIPVAKSRTLFTQSVSLMVVRSIGISRCLNRVPGRGGRIARREHDLIMCSSPSTSSLSKGFNAQ